MDTNILAFIWDSPTDNISDEVRMVISDYGNVLYTSSVCVMELIHLFQIGKLEIRKQRKSGLTSLASLVFEWLHELGVSMVPVTEKHLKLLAELPLYTGHRDPNDRLIIAQAICDKATLVSSDRDFSQYTKDGLDFLFNRR